MRGRLRRRIVAPGERRVALLHGQLRRAAHRRLRWRRRWRHRGPQHARRRAQRLVRLQRDWPSRCLPLCLRRRHPWCLTLRRLRPGRWRRLGRRAAGLPVLHLELQVIDSLAQVGALLLYLVLHLIHPAAQRPHLLLQGLHPGQQLRHHVVAAAARRRITPRPAEIGPAALGDLRLQRLHLLLQLVDLVAECDLLAGQLRRSRPRCQQQATQHQGPDRQRPDRQQTHTRLPHVRPARQASEMPNRRPCGPPVAA